MALDIIAASFVHKSTQRNCIKLFGNNSRGLMLFFSAWLAEIQMRINSRFFSKLSGNYFIIHPETLLLTWKIQKFIHGNLAPLSLPFHGGWLIAFSLSHLLLFAFQLHTKLIHGNFNRVCSEPFKLAFQMKFALYCFVERWGSNGPMINSMI